MKPPVDNTFKSGTSDGEVTLKSRQPVCENTVFSVFLDHVVDARGNEVTRYLSVIPKHTTSDGISGVAVLPIVDGKLGLIRVFRHPLNRWSWEIPKGFVDAGETPQQAAVRELGEETGYDIPIACLRQLGTVAPEAGVIKGRIQLFSAAVDGRDTHQVETNRELGHGKMRFFGVEELSGLIASGQLEDACTLSMLYLHFMQPESGQG